MGLNRDKDMKEPYFIFDRVQQRIMIGADKSIALQEFRTHVPAFNPPDCDRIEYFPGVRASMIKDDSQTGIPGMERLSDQSRWPQGDMFLRAAVKIWEAKNPKSRG